MLRVGVMSETKDQQVKRVVEAMAVAVWAAGCHGVDEQQGGA